MRRALCFLLLVAGADCPALAAVPLDLEPLRGQVVYLDFWASWCVPCRQTFPFMQSMQLAHGAEGLHVLAVGVDSERSDAELFLGRFAHPFDVRFDPAGEVASKFHVAGMPASVMIDRHGVVRYSHLGFRPGDAALIEAHMRELLAEH